MMLAASFSLTGLPAIILILVILALIITGVYTVVKKAKNKVQGK